MFVFPTVRDRFARSEAVFAVDCNWSSRSHVLHWHLCPPPPASQRGAAAGGRIFRTGLHLPLRDFLPIRLGTCSVEIPTVRLRSMNVAIGAYTKWLFNFIVARTTPNMLATLGPEWLRNANYSAEDMLKMQAELAKHDIPLATNQCEFSILRRHPETSGLLQASRDNKIVF